MKMASLSVETTDREPVQESDQKHSTRPFYSGDESYEQSNLRMNDFTHSNNENTDSTQTQEHDDCLSNCLMHCYKK